MNSALLDKISQSQDVCLAVLEAEAQELHWLKGIKLNEDIIELKASLNADLWTIELEVEHGYVTYRSHDKAAFIISIETRPKAKYVTQAEKLSETEINKILEENSNNVLIDLKDIASLTRAKNLLKDDYVLKNIPLANPTQDKASRLVIWHIRAYRKIFLDYQKKYGFLWQSTGFQNARSLASAMRNEGKLI